MSGNVWRSALLAVVFVTFSVSGAAQDQNNTRGDNPDAGAGTVGQRQTRESSKANIDPIARINNRVSNRVQSRIRSRIDRYYDPTANAASPFEMAGDQVRKTPRGGR